MSSPSPDPQKVEHAYPSSEASDHGLLGHAPHTCTCSEKLNVIETPKTELGHAHCVPKSNLHHVINLSHVPSSTSHIHPINQSVHVHVHPSPKTGQIAKIVPPSCNCHIQEDCENIGDMESAQQNRKMEEDRIEVSPLPPALPPRPPPRPRYDGNGSLNSRCRPRARKYT